MHFHNLSFYRNKTYVSGASDLALCDLSDARSVIWEANGRPLGPLRRLGALLGSLGDLWSSSAVLLLFPWGSCCSIVKKLLLNM